MIWIWCLALLLILIVLIFLVEEFFNLIFRGYAPFVSSKNNVLDEAVSQFLSLDLPDNAKIYELHLTFYQERVNRCQEQIYGQNKSE